MIGDGNEFVAACDGGIRHRANIAGAIAPICVHLQIAPKARAPRRGFGQPKATFGESEEFSPQRRRSRGMLLPANPLSDLLFKEGPICASSISGRFCATKSRASTSQRKALRAASR